ncbi:MAG: deoxyribonuclease IV [Actinomycetota bacterium]|nr:deoxyribonuclease IV [Actinomycetota bacterium]
MKFGYHVGIKGGFTNALLEGKEAGCQAIQMFPGNPGQWGTPRPSREEIEEFRSIKKKTGIEPVIIHSIYLVNMASPSDAVFKRSIGSLSSSLKLADELGAEGVVTHIGNHKGEGVNFGLERIASAVREVFNREKGRANLLLETTAGAGTSIGGRIDEFKEVFELSGWPKRLGFCLDTCHIFAAGYDISNPSVVDSMLEELEEKIGLERLKLLHLNDSKGKVGSHLDRHEHIGKGSIGLESFRRIVNHEKLRNLSAICELDYTSPEADDLSLLRSLLEE